MPFVGIVGRENDCNFIRNAVGRNLVSCNLEFVNINRNSIENIKNVKFDVLVICENVEKLLKNSLYLEDIIRKANYIIVNSDIKENLSVLKCAETNVITYGFNAKATITISSIKEDSLMVCVQRKIDGIGNVIEEQDFNIKIEKNNVNKLYNVLVIFTILAIYGKILQKI